MSSPSHLCPQTAHDTLHDLLAAFLTIAVLVLYEAVLLQVQRRHPDRLARSAHADLREQWFAGHLAAARLRG